MIKVLDDPNYTELQEENTWLRGSLREAAGPGERERLALMCMVLFAVSGNAAGVDLGRDYCGVGGGERR